VGALRRLPDAPEIRIFADDPGVFGAVDGEAVHVPWLRGRLRPLSERFHLPRLARREKIDLFHGTKHSLPPRLPCRSVVSIHDLAPFRARETFPALAGAYLRRSTASAARRADAIVTGSEATRRDLVAVLGVPSRKVAVIPYGVEERFGREPEPERLARVRTRIGLPSPLLLCLGTVQPRKGQREVLEAFARLRDRSGPRPSLLFVGRRGWLSSQFEEDLARFGGDEVRWIPDFPDADLPALFRAADLLVSASRVEGFGLAVAEAMASGLPVVALADGSIPEVAGDAAALVPTADPGVLAAEVARVLGDGGLRRSLAEAGRARAAAFTWESAAVAHRRLYASLAGD
jgi:glycosyltransferase involved in cell wall biosynthesis